MAINLSLWTHVVRKIMFQVVALQIGLMKGKTRMVALCFPCATRKLALLFNFGVGNVV